MAWEHTQSSCHYLQYKSRFSYFLSYISIYVFHFHYVYNTQTHTHNSSAGPYLELYLSYTHTHTRQKKDMMGKGKKGTENHVIL